MTALKSFVVYDEGHLLNAMTGELITNQRYRTIVRARKRAFRRFFLGATENAVTLITLTSAPDSPVDIQHSWRLWRLRLARRKINFEYFRVKELNEKGTLCHLHVCASKKFSRRELKTMRKQWYLVHRANWIRLTRIYKVDGIGNYLGKYLNKAAYSRAWNYSHKWIIPCFARFANAYRKLSGLWCQDYFPFRDVASQLAEITLLCSRYFVRIHTLFEGKRIMLGYKIMPYIDVGDSWPSRAYGVRIKLQKQAESIQQRVYEKTVLDKMDFCLYAYRNAHGHGLDEAYKIGRYDFYGWGLSLG